MFPALYMSAFSDARRLSNGVETCNKRILANGLNFLHDIESSNVARLARRHRGGACSAIDVLVGSGVPKDRIILRFEAIEEALDGPDPTPASSGIPLTD